MINPTGPNGILKALSGASAQIVAANGNRSGLVFMNCSATIQCWIAPATFQLAIGAGIPLIPLGRFDIMPPFPLTCGGAWNGLSESGTPNIIVLEFYGP